jgi:hypothetical protein
MNPVCPLVSLCRTRGPFQLGKRAPAKPPISKAMGGKIQNRRFPLRRDQVKRSSDTT